MVETKIFDPAQGFGAISDLEEATDSTLAWRGGQWWMYLAGHVRDQGIQLLSASLPRGAPLSAAGWILTSNPTNPSSVAVLARHDRSHAWDLKGGRHCPSYVRGWDPERGAWVERIYYAGGVENSWGPYVIGYLEWDGHRWVDQPEPAFVAEEEWERGSVYEPNLIYAKGKWKMWYVSGANQQDYLVQGFAESADGRSNWTKHQVFAPPEDKLFDFCVVKSGAAYEAVFSRVWLGVAELPAATGLWWCHADQPSGKLSDWSKPAQIMTAENRGWHAGPWKPAVHYHEKDRRKMFVFFDGTYRKGDGPFPFVFTLGCVEITRPE